jgi:hypothetical protein
MAKQGNVITEAVDDLREFIDDLLHGPTRSSDEMMENARRRGVDIDEMVDRLYPE